MFSRYTNSFKQPLNAESPDFFETDVQPTEYKGYLIYERIKGVCFDIVKDCTLVGQYAGLNGAKEFIDILTNRQIQAARDAATN